MSGADGARPTSGGEDPLSADRRTLLIAVIAMVVLIAVGVTSAAIFTRSACGAVEPGAVAAGTAGDDLPAVLAEALPGLEPGELDRLVAGLGARDGDGGDAPGDGEALPLTPVGAADVGAASDLTTLDGHLAATGERLTLLGGPAADGGVTAGPAAEVEDPAIVVGSGPTLYSLALVNEATGQVDAIVPVTDELAGGDCIDTAQVGVPLTFHLDATEGELLLFRVDDEGELPEVELRDAEGSVWSQRVVMQVGPPGALAERLDGMIGEELVVTARRTSADEDVAAIEARARASGTQQWSVAPSEVAELAPPGDEALVIELVAVTDERVLVAVAREQRDPVLLLGFDAADGQPLWVSDLDAHAAPQLVEDRGDELLVLAQDGRDGDLPTQRLARIDLDGGAATAVHSVSGERARAVVVGQQTLFAVDQTMTAVLDDGERHSVTLPVEIIAVAGVDDVAVVLLRHGDDGAVVWLRP